MSPASVCAECGAALKANAKFCGSCGAHVTAPAADAATEATAAEATATVAKPTTGSAAKATTASAAKATTGSASKTPSVVTPAVVTPAVVAPVTKPVAPVAKAVDLPAKAVDLPGKPVDLPAGSTLAPVAASAPTSSRKIVIAVAAVVGVLLVVVAGIAIGSAVNGPRDDDSASSSYEDSNDHDANTSDNGDSDVDSGDDAPQQPDADPSTEPILFASVSGNIQCSAVPQGVSCHQKNIKYTAPSGSCVTGIGGASVGVNRDGAFWPCFDAELSLTTTQPYDLPLQVYDYTCSISHDTGIRCFNANGQGFVMEYTNGIQTF